MLRRTLLATVAASAVAAILLAPADSALAQRIYIGPGGIGVGIGNTPSYRYRDPFYYGPSARYRSDYDLLYGPGYTYRYGGPYYYSRDIDDLNTYDWLRLGLGLSLTPRYSYYYRDGRTYLYSTPQYANPQTTRSDALRPPTQQQLDQLSWNDLARVIENGVGIFDQQLAGVDTGSQWRTYFRLEQLRGAVQGDQQGPPTQTTSDQLNPVLAKFDRIADQGQYGKISDMVGFQIVHAALADYLTPPAQRQWRILAGSARVLDDSLGRLSTGEGWRTFLSLSRLTGQEDADASTLATALSRFQQVAGDDEYRMVAELDGFVATRRALEDLLVNTDVRAGRGPEAVPAPPGLENVAPAAGADPLEDTPPAGVP